jgi:hypothetical protein
MNKKGQQEYDSESEDSDYNPNQDPNNSDKGEDSKAPVEREMTALEKIKDNKRNREVDDLFDLMNEEDPIMKKARENKR